jgi:hypothetical protein
MLLSCRRCGLAVVLSLVFLLPIIGCGPQVSTPGSGDTSRITPGSTVPAGTQGPGKGDTGPGTSKTHVPG